MRVDSISNENLRQIIRRPRAKVQTASPKPADLASIVAPVEAQSYASFAADGGLCLLRNSAPGDAARHLVFGTGRNADYPSNAPDSIATELSTSRHLFPLPVYAICAPRFDNCQPMRMRSSALLPT